MDIGVIGTGVMGRNHVRVYSELKQVDTVYVYDLNQKQAETVADQNEATSIPDLEKMLRTVDAVSLCVPTQFHHDLAQTVIDAGVNILIEKPICLNSTEGRDLLERIPKDLIVGVGHIERFNPIVPEIRKIISNPLYVELKRHNPASLRISGSSVVEDLMIHDIDILMHALCTDSLEIQSRGNDDIGAALCRSKNAIIYLSASRKASKKIRSIHIEQEDMTIQGNFMSQEIYVHRKPEQYHIENERYVQENIVEKVQVAKQEPLRTELLRFISCIRTNKPFPVTPEQAVMNLEICERIKEGFDNGC